MINERHWVFEMDIFPASALALVLCIFPFESVTALSCAYGDMSEDEFVAYWYERSDAIFVGRTREPHGGWIDVEAVWKGAVPPVVYINHATKAKDSREALFFGKGPQNDGSYESVSGGFCFWMPDYKYSVDYLSRVYGPGTLPREDHFASSWFVSLALMFLMGAGLWVWTVVRTQNSRRF